MKKETSMFAENSNNRIQKFSKAGTHIASFPTKQSPRGVIVTSDNKIIISDTHGITVYNGDGIYCAAAIWIKRVLMLTINNIYA